MTNETLTIEIIMNIGDKTAKYVEKFDLGHHKGPGDSGDKVEQMVNMMGCMIERTRVELTDYFTAQEALIKRLKKTIRGLNKEYRRQIMTVNDIDNLMMSELNARSIGDSCSFEEFIEYESFFYLIDGDTWANVYFDLTEDSQKEYDKYLEGEEINPLELEVVIKEFEIL